MREYGISERSPKSQWIQFRSTAVTLTELKDLDTLRHPTRTLPSEPCHRGQQSQRQDMSPAQLTVPSICHGIKRAQYFGCGNTGGGGAVNLPVKGRCLWVRSNAVAVLCAKYGALSRKAPVLRLCPWHTSTPSYTTTFQQGGSQAFLS